VTSRIAHIGIAVTDLEQAIAVFTDILGQPPDYRETIPGHSVRTAWFNLAGARLELLESTSPESPVARFIAKHGAGIHHLCLDVADLTGTRPADAAVSAIERLDVAR
jgi:methylmalonyl-CoA epimerase